MSLLILRTGLAGVPGDAVGGEPGGVGGARRPRFPGSPCFPAPPGSRASPRPSRSKGHCGSGRLRAVPRGVRPQGAGRPRGGPGPRRPGLGYRAAGVYLAGLGGRVRGRPSRSARCGGAGRTIRRPGASRPSVTVAETGHHRVRRRRRGTAGVMAAGSVTASPCAAAGLATAPVSSARAVTVAAAAGAVTAGRVTAASSGTAAAAMPAPSLAGWPPGRSRRKTRARGTARAMMTAPARKAWV